MSFNVGDKVKCISHRIDSEHNLTIGRQYVIKNIGINDPHGRSIMVVGNNGSDYIVQPFCLEKVKQEKNMLDSVKEYVKEHRQVIITIGVVLLVDHLIFGGAFREKVKSLVDGLLNKAQKQLDDK